MPNSSNLFFILFVFFFIYELAGQSFVIPVRVSDGTNQLILKFGIHPEGSDYYDAGLDIYAPPPPPAGAFDARLTFKQEDYFTDIRDNSITAKEYHIKYQPEGQKKITVYWNADTLAQFGSFKIVDPFTAQMFSMDMEESDSLDISTVNILSNGLKIIMTPLSTSLKSKSTNQPPNKINLINRPNPFNAKTIIEYSLENPAKIVLEIYSQTGQRVEELVRAYLPAGHHQYFWDGTRLVTGLYYCTLRTETETVSIKLLHVR